MFAFTFIPIKTSGLVLTELILSTVLALLLLASLLTIYRASLHSLDEQTAINRLKDNASAAARILQNDIHQAGYIGCPVLSVNFPLHSSSADSLTPQNKIIGSDHDIILRHAAYPNANLTATMSDELTLYVSNAVTFKPGERLIVSDCKKADIFVAQSVAYLGVQQKITASNPLQANYDNTAEVARVEINHYFVAATSRQHADHTPVFALFVEDEQQRKIELVEEVTQMQLFYSVYRDGQLIDLPASAIEDWSQVVGVNIQLTISSPPFQKNWYGYVAL